MVWGDELVLDQVEDLPGPRAGGVDKLDVKALGRWIFQRSMSEESCGAASRSALEKLSAVHLELALDHTKASTSNGVWETRVEVRRAGCSGGSARRRSRLLPTRQQVTAVPLRGGGGGRGRGHASMLEGVRAVTRGLTAPIQAEQCSKTLHFSRNVAATSAFHLSSAVTMS